MQRGAPTQVRKTETRARDTIPLRYTRRQLYTDLLRAKVDRNQIDGIPTPNLYALWKEHCRGKTTYKKTSTRVPTLRVIPQPLSRPNECWCRLRNAHTSNFSVGHSNCQRNWYPGAPETTADDAAKLGAPWTLNGTHWICGHRANPWLPTSWYSCCFPAYVVPFIHPLNDLEEHPAYSGHRGKRAITEAERFWMMAFPSYGTARLSREVIQMTSVLETLANETAVALQHTEDALTRTAAELTAVRMVALQNRMALDYLLAADGGTCAMVGKKCCTFIPGESSNITHIRDLVAKIQKSRDQLLQHNTSWGNWWPFGSLGGWWTIVIH
ncbi:endogenous retrovirus group PABLB member 1 Env polyprotein-like [Hypanus sabinus]|uniref:endogenous retrovirus group PABLB member 1 Env polyprotein-like n=1 Tax=Hypanus sabinus TaxID=79690 RepID=UPI0028C4A38C|nr:endogenous retrovirus group PABLB member 1 Env polyprotein-like [Hypanus sabinus]